MTHGAELNDARLRLAVRAANVGLWDWDLRTNRVCYSPEWKRQIGHEEDEISDDFNEWQSRVHPDDLPQALATVQAFIAKPWPDYRNVFRFRHKDGSYRWILAQAALVCDEHGRPVRMLGSHVDITREREAESARRESEEQFHELFATAHDLILFVAPSGSVVRVNPAFQRCLGYTQEEAARLTIRDFLHPDFLPGCMAHLAAVVAGRDVGNVAAAFLAKDGRTVFVEGACSCSLKDGRPTVIRGIFRDVSERMLAEEALRESEAKFRALAEESLVGVYVIQDGRFRYVNTAQAQILGYTREELLALPSVLETVTGEDRPRVLENIRRRVTGETRVARYELVAVRKDGGRRRIEVLGAATTFEGRPAVMGTCLDITERHQAEQAMREVLAGTAAQLGRDFFQSLVQHLARALAVKYALVGELTAPDHKRVRVVSCWAGDAHAQPFEYDLAGTPCEDVADGTLCFHSCGACEKFPRDALLREMGVQSYLGIPLVGARGKPIGLLIVMHDRPREFTEFQQSILTVFAARAGAELERLRAEEALQKLSSAVAQTADSVIITDRNGAIEYVNASFERIAGYTLAEVRGKTPRVLKSGCHPATFYEELWRTITAGQSFHAEFTNRRKDGHLYQVEKTITPLRNVAGEITHFVSVGRDVSERKQLEEQLRQSQKMESIGRLAGGVAHDFNNILTVIQGHTSLLLMSAQMPGDIGSSIREIAEAAERAANLTRQLLAFSRRQVMQPRHLDLNETANGLARMLWRILGEDVRLQLDLHPRPQVVFADPGMIDQVIMNLAVNARDAMPAGGRLTIETGERTLTQDEARLIPDASPGRYVCLAISDTGAGIPPNILPRIFEPFFTTKESGKGTGLGLATVFGIVKQHGGWIQVNSEIGQGTTFRIFLPASNASTAPQETPPIKPRGGTETILFAEDDDAVREVTRCILERHGYRVLEAPNGVEALRIWREQHASVDLLLTDIVMPENISGRELAQRLLADNPKLRVIFTTGYRAEIAGREFKLEEGQNFLQKPCSPEKLLESVRRCLDG